MTTLFFIFFTVLVINEYRMYKLYIHLIEDNYSFQLCNICSDILHANQNNKNEVINSLHKELELIKKKHSNIMTNPFLSYMKQETV